ncbi:hypothetical protein [Parafrigoribacterium soli]|uniref:hypothetical protein n=1 Tax=Parafrigoribacterium soli TaxID=3144663 RepID=UPI0032EFEB58
MAQVQDLNPREKRPADSITQQALRREEIERPLDGDAGVPTRSKHATLRRRAHELVCVHYGGRRFIASFEMAGIFLRRAQRLIDSGEAELVPLLHEDGLEMLHVAPSTPFSVHDLDAEPADGLHGGLPAAGECPSEVS